MDRTLVLGALLPLLASCDFYRTERDARARCEEGVRLIADARAGLQRPALTDPERRRIKSDYLEGILAIRAGLSMPGDPVFFFKPEKYHRLSVSAAFEMTDSRLIETPP